MHTPDGLITGWICVLMLLISAGAIIFAFLNRKKWLTKEKIPLMALVASTTFLLQMLNFPIAQGTSGHFLGAAFAAILLGPYAAIITIALVVVTQALVFGDGGLLALGANTFNMAIVGVISATLAYRQLEKRMPEKHAFFASSWLSVLAASASASLLLSISGAPALQTFSAMLLVHAIIGIGEAIIGIGAIAAISSAARGFAQAPKTFARAVPYVIAALAFTWLLLPFASGSPDGMEKVAIDIGFYSAATTLFEAPLPDYTVPGLAQGLTTAAAALIGATLCFAAASILSHFAKPSEN